MALGEIVKYDEFKKDNISRRDVIEFKGNKNGLIINIKEECDINIIKEQLTNKMVGATKFFKGAKIAKINCSFLDDLEKIELKDYISTTLNVEFMPEEELADVFSGIYEGNTKFVRTTLRSGMKINYNGNVVVIGDVNPGGQVVASGNIIIMGHLRGMVHAGANGNKDAVVVSFNLDAMQIRIGDIIGIAPDGNNQKPTSPEIAYVKENCIIIEPYLNKK